MSISNVLAKHGLGVPEGSRPGTAPGPPPGERTSSPDHRRTASAPAVAPEVHHTQRHQLNREESRTSVPGIEVVTPVCFSLELRYLTYPPFFSLHTLKSLCEWRRVEPLWNLFF